MKLALWPGVCLLVALAMPGCSKGEENSRDLAQKTCDALYTPPDTIPIGMGPPSENQLVSQLANVREAAATAAEAAELDSEWTEFSDAMQWAVDVISAELDALRDGSWPPDRVPGSIKTARFIRMTCDANK